MNELLMMLLVHPSARTGDVWGDVFVGVVSTLAVALFLFFLNHRKDKKNENGSKHWDEVNKEDMDDKN